MRFYRFILFFLFLLLSVTPTIVSGQPPQLVESGIDQDPPIITDNLSIDTNRRIVIIRDDRPTDMGLDTIYWAPSAGTDSTRYANFIIVLQYPLDQPCDKNPKNIFITKVDSTISGCIDFTAIDCLGHKTIHTVCFAAVITDPIHPDSNKPHLYLTQRTHIFDGADSCNSRIDSLIAFDTTIYDTGIKSIEVISATNMVVDKPPIKPGIPFLRYSVSPIDSMFDGRICLVIKDMATPIPNISDTFCIDYCTIRDTLCPQVIISPSKGSNGPWHIFISDNRPWDRTIDHILISNPNNVTPSSISIPDSLGHSVGFFSFTISTIDTTQPSGFCITAFDKAGNSCDSLCMSIGAYASAPVILSDDILISPNPASNNIYLRFFDQHTNQTIKANIFDSHGVLMLSNTMSIPGELNLRSFSKGEYNLQIQTGNKTLNRKFIVE